MHVLGTPPTPQNFQKFNFRVPSGSLPSLPLYFVHSELVCINVSRLS